MNLADSAKGVIAGALASAGITAGVLTGGSSAVNYQTLALDSCNNPSMVVSRSSVVDSFAYSGKLVDTANGEITRVVYLVWSGSELNPGAMSIEVVSKDGTDVTQGIVSTQELRDCFIAHAGKAEQVHP